MVVVQVLCVFILVSAARSLEHHSYEAPAYHQVYAAAPSKGAVSFASFTSHHSAPKAIVAPIHHSAPIFAAAEHPKEAAASYASFSSSIAHPVAIKQEIAHVAAPLHYVEQAKAETSFGSISTHGGLGKGLESIAVPVGHYVAEGGKGAASSFSSIQHAGSGEGHQGGAVVHFGHVAPVGGAHEAHHEVDYYAEPKYEYKYGVEDGHTGDKKSQHEQRDGEHTQGQYSLVEPDGTILTVDYSVVGKSGFNAVVHRTGHAVHPQVHKSH